MSGRLAITVCLSVVAVGCGWTTSVRSLGPGERALPVADWGEGDQRFLCAGVGFADRVELRGSPNDPRTAWAMSRGRRLDLVWPEGYSARFAPLLEVLDETGTVVARDGDVIEGGCRLGDPNAWFIDF